MSDPDVLVIGEALVDIVDASGAEVEHVGGSPANVALGLGRRGRSVALLTRLGQDARSDLIVRHLRESHVDVLPDSFGARAASTARATLAADGSASYRFDIEWDLPAIVPDLNPALVHTGSLALFLDPGASELDRFLDGLRAPVISVDPNIRPALLPDHAVALRRFEALAARATLVKMSDEDAAWLYPELSLDEALRRTRAVGARLAVGTRGAHGAILLGPSSRVEIAGVTTSVADTIGAGDTFMASLIDDYLASTGELDATLLRVLGTRAATAAALTVSRPGADLPWAAELGTTGRSASL
ncbi:fructokinase [Microbacterium sp. ru370.1]|uniref:PfkB family carbohydrate kinase n=1 Tax=unclassified Microbacterium TaxID=2609290 RepID=UPI0008887C24|nr:MULTISPECIES: PfkB family carbohydrate kinase [unclassified Microbacterium]SDO98948.1 fructokinase [Microbacterium sp. ru370.1]SIT92508.1 fructokinase [Microbacterium sp. RU1D]